MYETVWKIEYWYSKNGKNSFEDWLDSLTHEQVKAVAKELKLLECCGSELRLPHSRALGRGLFELRERKFGYRIYYTFVVNKVIVLLQGGDKSSQQRDIRIAQRRLVELNIETKR